MSNLIHSPSSSSPAWSFLRSHFFSHSYASFFLPTSVAYKNLRSGATAFLFASRSASHLLLTWACHLIPSLSSSLTSFLLTFLHLWHFVYKCPTVYSVSLHHYYWGVSILFIPARYIPTARCLTFSWWYSAAYFLGAFSRTRLITAFVHEI